MLNMPNIFCSVAAIKFKMCSYLQNKITLASENVGNLFFFFFTFVN